MFHHIILTGASGFVGQNLSSYLQKDVEYRLITLGRKDLAEPVIQFNANVETVIHLAGKAHDMKSVSRPDEYYEVNSELTKRLFDAFLRSDAKTFIFISSVKAAADTVQGVLTESFSPDPRTHYGKSKLMAEQYIQEQPLPSGKSYYILRPCMIHGPGNKGNLNLLYKFVEKGIPYPLAAFENKRSLLSIENLCFIIRELTLKKDIPSGIYNVADDKPLSTNEIVSILAASLGKKPRLWRLSAGFIHLLAKIGNVLRLPLNTERLQKLTENYVVSNAKIKLVINAGLPLESTEGLSVTASSFKVKNN